MISIDVVLHLRDRLRVFHEVARVLVPGGRFLFTDAGVVTGSISSEEVSLRAIHGYNQFVAPGFNERLLHLAGYRLMDCSDRSGSLLKNASGRFATRLAHAAELHEIEGSAQFGRQQRYRETVIDLSERGALSRMLYLAQRVM